MVKVKHALIPVCVLFLYGCASTDELFAEYDAQHCAVPEAIVKETIVKETIVKVQKPKSLSIGWKPAVYFGTNESKVSARELASLKINLKTLNRLSDHKISLHGFTDQQGNAAYNARLAKKRVAQVTSELVSLGLARGRIVSESHGEEFAVMDVKEGPVERDRRVDMILLDGNSTPVHQQPSIKFNTE